ncbi:hypothetical protein Rs2_42483 [Raphanus sativus]|nr:hypothetical protein Rs2_42483 [Raphanus sativus]
MEEELEKEIPMSCFAYKKNKILSQLSPSLVLSVSVSIMQYSVRVSDCVVSLSPLFALVVDRSASKSRKIRYNVHEKIVNFMAPRRIKIPPNSGDLLKNLFGLKTRNGLLQVVVVVQPFYRG